jgi:hypothetical protein
VFTQLLLLLFLAFVLRREAIADQHSCYVMNMVWLGILPAGLTGHAVWFVHMVSCVIVEYRGTHRPSEQNGQSTHDELKLPMMRRCGDGSQCVQALIPTSHANPWAVQCKHFF